MLIFLLLLLYLFTQLLTIRGCIMHYFSYLALRTILVGGCGVCGCGSEWGGGGAGVYVVVWAYCYTLVMRKEMTINSN